jgi:hypothetical protein
MRALIALVLLGACFGVGSSGASRPAVMPMLSELPGDSTKRDAVLESANTTAGPEQRKGMTAKQRKVETAAATAAAIIGSMFSSTPSVTIGSASQFEENQLIAPDAVPAVQPPSTGSADDAAKPDAPPTGDAGTSNADLVPWIKLK